MEYIRKINNFFRKLFQLFEFNYSLECSWELFIKLFSCLGVFVEKNFAVEF